ncbi:hypothetical protein [Flagellimonas crocea]|uniref:hypothetical protein n=1 Tax=Flagellimonas crocea TaxID=3067311 RepID=UPI00296F9DA3|nr:hypothetical protein [Muricauda sp. DH64]
MRVKILLVVLLAISFGFWVGCKSVNPPVSYTNKDIIGSWEGCDGRVVTFSKDENGGVLGRYSKLGGLGRYRFSLNEIGFHITQKKPGTYVGQVKWKNTMGNETWREETIEVEGNILKTTSSDNCGKELKRVKGP